MLLISNHHLQSAMNSHNQDAAAAAASMSSLSGNAFSNSVLERLLQQNRTVNGHMGSSQGGVAPSPLSGDAGGIMNQQDLLSAQIDRNRMLAVLQQQQRQLAASMAHGRPVLQQNISSDFVVAPRFMVDDFAGAGNLLSRSDQDILLSRFPAAMAASGHLGLGGGGHSELDFGNTNKIADLLLAKQVAFHEANKPRTSRLPCQARGMKADHNSSTAFFEIPDDARHGQHLLCSHPSCRASGIKFRYCLYCKKPVTKQNFRSRHLHSDLDNNSTNDDDEANSGKVSKQTKALSPDRKRSSPSSSIGAEVSAEMRCIPISTCGGRSKDDGREEGRKMMKMTPPADNADAALTSGLNPDSEALGLVSRRRRWANLLKERPSDLDTMDKWLSSVISVSDPRSAMGNADSLLVEPKISKTALQESRWAELFEQRPAAGEGSGAITEWLVQILETSCTAETHCDHDVLHSRTSDDNARNKEAES